jgi:hypothetical protein
LKQINFFNITIHSLLIILSNIIFFEHQPKDY